MTSGAVAECETYGGFSLGDESAARRENHRTGGKISGVRRAHLRHASTNRQSQVTEFH